MMLLLRTHSLLILCAFFTALSCKRAEKPLKQVQENHTPASPGSNKNMNSGTIVLARPADAGTVLNRKQVPILCYHQLREWRLKDSKVAKDYIVPPVKFAEQMKMLADSGYHTILPDQLYNYLNTDAVLPPRPVMITFDDTDLSQYETGLKELDKYGFKGVFFIMTVSIDRPGYMSKEQIRDLSDKGHVIGCHTWDHHNVKKYLETDWKIQVDRPKHQLENITGKPVRYFAYPFGLWNEEAIPYLKARDMLAAFQLSEKRSTTEPLYSIRRMIVPGYWETRTVNKWLHQNF